MRFFLARHTTNTPNESSRLVGRFSLAWHTTTTNESLGTRWCVPFPLHPHPQPHAPSLARNASRRGLIPFPPTPPLLYPSLARNARRRGFHSLRPPTSHRLVGVYVFFIRFDDQRVLVTRWCQFFSFFFFIQPPTSPCDSLVSFFFFFFLSSNHQRVLVTRWCVLFYFISQLPTPSLARARETEGGFF